MEESENIKPKCSSLNQDQSLNEQETVSTTCTDVVQGSLSNGHKTNTSNGNKVDDTLKEYEYSDSDCYQKFNANNPNEVVYSEVPVPNIANDITLEHDYSAPSYKPSTVDRLGMVNGKWICFSEYRNLYLQEHLAGRMALYK